MVIIAYNLFLHNAFEFSYMGLGVSLFFIAFLLALFFAFPKAKRTALAYGFLGTGIFASIFISIRASALVQWIDGLTIVSCLLTLVFFLASDQFLYNGLWVAREKVSFFAKGLRHILVFFKFVFSQSKSTHKTRTFAIVKTTVITLVIVGVFASLLAAADPVFADFIKEIREEFWGRFFASLFLAFCLMLALSFSFKTAPKPPTFSIFSFYDVVLPVAAMLVLFAIFLGIQWEYLFTNQADFQSLDLTYSDYVRKGFMELLFTSFLGGMIAYFVILKERTLTAISQIRLLKILNILLVVELFALLASAFKRDFLYITVYEGLTRIRLTGSVLLAWLVGFFVLILLLALFRKMQEKRLFQGLWVISLAVLLFFNVMNVDQTIANWNLSKQTSPDYFYISNLSADAVEGWEASLYAAQDFLQTLVNEKRVPTDAEKVRLADFYLLVSTIEHSHEKLAEDSRHSILALNRSVYNSLLVLENLVPDTLSGTSYPTTCLLREIKNYQLTYGVDLGNEADDRLYSFEYPLMGIDRAIEYPWLQNILSEILDDESDELVAQIDTYYGGVYDVNFEEFQKDEYGIFKALKAEYAAEPFECF